MEEVQCSECATRYDSQVQAFCPRCGNEGSRPLQGPVATPRFDPRRRRAQMGGLILAVLGLATLVQLAWVAAFPEPLSDAQLEEFSGVELFQAQPGGDLMLRIVLDGESVQANVTWHDMQGRPLANATTEDGWANATGLGSAFGTIRIEAAQGNHTTSFYAPAGGAYSDVIDLREPPAWTGARQVTATRVVSGFLAFFAAFVVLAGIMAFRLRGWRIALAGGILAIVPALMLAFVSPLAGLLLLLPAALALAFIIAGKAHFT